MIPECNQLFQDFFLVCVEVGSIDVFIIINMIILFFTISFFILSC